VLCGLRLCFICMNVLDCRNYLNFAVSTMLSRLCCIDGAGRVSINSERINLWLPLSGLLGGAGLHTSMMYSQYSPVARPGFDSRQSVASKSLLHSGKPEMSSSGYRRSKIPAGLSLTKLSVVGRVTLGLVLCALSWPKQAAGSSYDVS
jgi:hypothetical protein